MTLYTGTRVDHYWRDFWTSLAATVLVGALVVFLAIEAL